MSIALALVLAGLVCGPAQAAPQRLGDLPLSANPGLATSPAGHTVLVLTHREPSRLTVRVALPGRRFGRRREVPTSRSVPGRRDPRDVRVITGDDGWTVIVWTALDESREPEEFDRNEGCCRRVRGVVMDARGRFGRPALLSAPNDGGSNGVATVRGRRAAVAWSAESGTYVAVAGRNGRFGRALRLAGEGQLIAVRLAPAGPRVVTFEPAGGVVELRGARGRRLLGAFVIDGYLSDHAASPSGHVLLAEQPFSDPRARAAVRLAHGRPGARLRFSVVRLGGRSSTWAVMGRDGRGLLVIERYDRRSTVQLVAVDRNGRPGSVRSLAGAGAAYELAFAVGGRGRSVAVGPGTVRGRPALVAWLLEARGRIRRVVVARPSGRSAVSVDGRGRVMVVFANRRGIYAERLPA